MDIDDILAGVAVDHDAIPQGTLNLQALTRTWVTERVSPELMPYPDGLMERTMERIRRQIEVVEMQTGDMDPKTNFRLIVIQTELERFKFLVRSFLRARIAKIDKHPLHILSTPALKSRLSALELRYLAQHQSLLHAHYLSSFLSNFPEQLRRLDDTAGGISMVERPDLETAVFVRVLRDVNLARDVGGAAALEGGQLTRGEVCVVRYSLVRESVLSGDVELI